MSDDSIVLHATLVSANLPVMFDHTITGEAGRIERGVRMVIPSIVLDPTSTVEADVVLDLTTEAAYDLAQALDAAAYAAVLVTRKIEQARSNALRDADSDARRRVATTQGELDVLNEILDRVS